MQLNYPQEWADLPRNERRKKLRQLKRAQLKKSKLSVKVKTAGLVVAVLVILTIGYQQLTQKSPAQLEFEQKIAETSLEGKVEEFEIEGREHVNPGTSVSYQTNPPTSGGHLGQAEGWGVYSKEIDDKAAVHGLEHGGIWISYKDIDDETKKELKKIGKANSQSVIVSPRAANEAKITLVSWGRMMKLEVFDQAMIQKYIDTYKNQSPEKLAR